jgi:hypothetical protein
VNHAVAGAMSCADETRATRSGAGVGLESWWVLSSPPRLAFAGEVDLASIAEFDAVFRGVRARHDRFAVDLRGLEFLSSMGIATMLRHRDSIVAVLVTKPGLVHRVLSLVGFPRPLISATPPPGLTGQGGCRVSAR